MCKPDTATGIAANGSNGVATKVHNKAKPLLLFSLGSYADTPSLAGFMVTGITFVSFLVGMEMLMRYILYEYRHVLPTVLGDEGAQAGVDTQINRYILARHLGVDTVSCLICVWLGLQGRAVWEKVLFSAQDALLGNPKSTQSNQKKDDDKNNKPTKNDDSYMPQAGYADRLFTYHPVGFRCCVFFFWYQVKNLYDTLVWNDGPEYVAHHIFSMITAYGCMYPGAGHLYALFFFGLSEISTAVLCVLANFDPDLGVTGLGDALPTVKLVLGAVFTVSFILIRCILWPLFAYHCLKDIRNAFKFQKLGHYDARTDQRRYWLYWFVTSLSSLSVLQVVWLGQIFLIAHRELDNMGYL